MKKISLKTLYSFILFLAIVLIVSGCGRKNGPTAESPLPPFEKGGEENIATSTGEIDTSDWKIYRNEEYGYVIKYPGDWTLSDNNPFTPIHSSVQFNHSVSKIEGAILRINMPEYGHGAESYETISVELFQLSGIEAKKIIRKILKQFSTNASNENNIYISFHDKKFNYESGIEFIYSDANQEYYKDVFNKMLSSLQFTN